MKRIILKKGEERRILEGHPWVYDNEVEAILEGKGNAAVPAALEAGECADVEAAGKRYLGRAFVNPASKIIARIYSPSKEGVDAGFFKRRIREAALRRGDRGPLSSFRLVFAEADFLPGLIIDCFTGWGLDEIQNANLERPLKAEAVQAALGNPKRYLVVQFLAFGIEPRRDVILQALEETAPSVLGEVAAIVEKSAASVRTMEGLEPREGVLRGEVSEQGIVIFENGYPFAVGLLRGQKTGHFLDQAENHHAIETYARGRKRVLDAFAYTGGFAIHCARSGAERVVAVDSSKSAIRLLGLNAALNNVESRIETICADVFEVLDRYERTKERFDLVILDPPAFAKSHAALTAAIAGYKEINMKALRLLERGGILASCSCSFALSEGAFKKMIRSAACDAGRRLIRSEFRSQATCHPQLVGYDESHYLKCGIYTAVV